MRFLAVDDEPLMLEALAEAIKAAKPEAEVLSFGWAEDALEAAQKQTIDVAFLDIQLGSMTGLELAARLKKIHPDIHIIFATGYSQYAVAAFQMHATGYLLKPVKKEDIDKELTFIYPEEKIKSKIKVQTFGGFEVFVDGVPLKFERTKAKELLAYLVDRRGAAVNTGEICASIYENTDDKKAKSAFRVQVHELKKVLKQAGIEELLRTSRNSVAIAPEQIDCDYYRFLEGDPIAVNQYHNDYMPAYSWAESRNGSLGFGD